MTRINIRLDGTLAELTAAELALRENFELYRISAPQPKNGAQGLYLLFIEAAVKDDAFDTKAR